VNALYKMCAGRTLLPRSLHSELLEGSTDVVVFRSGSADVSKREHRGQEVAVKVLRVYDDSYLQSMTSVSNSWASDPFRVWRTQHNLCRGSAKRSLPGKLFGIRTCYRCWG
jgi:hypothetical protein